MLAAETSVGIDHHDAAAIERWSRTGFGLVARETIDALQQTWQQARSYSISFRN